MTDKGGRSYTCDVPVPRSRQTSDGIGFSIVSRCFLYGIRGEVLVLDSFASISFQSMKNFLLRRER